MKSSIPQKRWVSLGLPLMRWYRGLPFFCCFSEFCWDPFNPTYDTPALDAGVLFIEKIFDLFIKLAYSRIYNYLNIADFSIKQPEQNRRRQC